MFSSRPPNKPASPFLGMSHFSHGRRSRARPRRPRDSAPVERVLQPGEQPLLTGLTPPPGRSRTGSTRPDEDTSPFVTVHVADRDTREYFKYTWHSRDTGLSVFGRSSTRLRPERRGTDGPSVQAAMFRTREVADQRS
ncbi:hypothetical protein SVIOM74S_07179 [Streptomyces violarus]